MRTRVIIPLCLLTGLIQCVAIGGQGANGYGPEVKSFLEYLRHEQDELDFQIKHNEIPRKNYIRAKNKIAILREAVLGRVKETGEDRIPEYHVVTASEVDQLIEEGINALKGAKPGDEIAGKWRYIESVMRGERFYVLERLAAPH